MKLRERVTAIIDQHVGWAGVWSDDLSLAETLGLDSLDRVEFAMTIEEEIFDDQVEIPDEEIEGWKTVGDVIASVEAHQHRRLHLQPVAGATARQ